MTKRKPHKCDHCKATYIDKFFGHAPDNWRMYWSKLYQRFVFICPGEDKHEHHDNKGTKEGDQPKASEEQPPEEPDATKGESASGVKNQETGTNPDGGADASIK